MLKLDVKRILIPTDFSETADLALEHASHLAKLCNAEIILLHVVTSYAFKANLPEINAEDEAFNAKLSGVVGSKLEEYAASLSEKFSCPVHTKVAYGSVRDEVVRMANDLDADIIILGTHGVSGIREFFMGSNAFRIVSEAGCPVLSVQRNATKIGFEHIVVPVDNSFHSREKIGLAIRMANTYNATLHICGMRSHDHDDADLNAKFRIKMKQVEDYLTEREVKFTATTLFCANIATATMDYAQEKGADLILIMNEQETNTTGFFLGPYAQQIVNHSAIPVLSMRPTSGYISGATPY
jgi:nucleotide-binding universal stress UspA family protein